MPLLRGEARSVKSSLTLNPRRCIYTLWVIEWISLINTLKYLNVWETREGNINPNLKMLHHLQSLHQDPFLFILRIKSKNIYYKRGEFQNRMSRLLDNTKNYIDDMDVSQFEDLRQLYMTNVIKCIRKGKKYWYSSQQSHQIKIKFYQKIYRLLGFLFSLNTI